MRTILVIILICCFTGCDFRSSESYHKEAQQLETQKKYKEAIPLLDIAIKKDRKNINALLDRAVDKSMLHDNMGAIADYSKVIELDSTNGLAFLNRGKNKCRIEDYKGAIADFNKAIATKGGELVYLNKVENSFVETGWQYHVDMEEIRYERGVALYDIDDLKGAYNDFSFCLDKGYNKPGSYYYRGAIYLSYKMKTEGCADLMKAKELGDSDAPELLDNYCK
jgi:tetratricopeptide (TPR) repeat protein